MITKLQKLFHTDKWWGKLLFIFLFNILFFILGIIIYPLFSWIDNIKLIFSSGWFSLLYFCFLLPLLSCVLVYKIFRKINIDLKKIFLVFLNIIIIIFIFTSYFFLAYFSIRPNFL